MTAEGRTPEQEAARWNEVQRLAQSVRQQSAELAHLIELASNVEATTNDETVTETDRRADADPTTRALLDLILGTVRVLSTEAYTLASGRPSRLDVDEMDRPRSHQTGWLRSGERYLGSLTWPMVTFVCLGILTSTISIYAADEMASHSDSSWPVWTAIAAVSLFTAGIFLLYRQQAFDRRRQNSSTYLAMHRIARNLYENLRRVRSLIPDNYDAIDLDERLKALLTDLEAARKLL